MRLLIALLLLAATICRGAVPSYLVFRGSGGIAITTNPPNGLIVIDGSGIFTSSGTNATISTSTNGVLVAVASTNINVVIGNNMAIVATNSASVSHFGIGIKSNLSFYATGGEMVLGTWGTVAGFSNAATGDLMLYTPEVAAGNDMTFAGVITAPNAIFNAMPGSGSSVNISAGGTLVRTNMTNFGTIFAGSIYVTNLFVTTNEITAQFLTQIIYLTEVAITNVVNGFTNAAAGIVGLLSNTNDRNVRVKGLLAGSNITLTDNGTNITITAAASTPTAETNSVLTNLIGTVARNVTNVVSLSTTNATSKPLTNSFTAGTLTLFGLEAGANVTITPNASNLVIAASASGGAAPVTNIVSLSTTNATSKPLTNSFVNGILTLPGIEAGANVTITANGSNWVIASTGGFSVSGNSNQIPYLNQAGNAFIFGGTQRSAPGFGYSKAANFGNGALMVHEDETNALGLLVVGPPNPGSYVVRYTPSLNLSNRYGFDSGINGGNTMTQDMVNINFGDFSGGSDPQSSIQQWKWWPEGASAPFMAARLRKDGQLTLGNGTLYASNSLVSAFPTAAQLGAGGFWVGVSNGPPATLVCKYSLDGTTITTKVLVP